jgi:hypothetical protein
MPFLDDVTSWTAFIVRMIAAVGGFVVGYMASGPFWRLFWRGVFRKPIPPGLLPWVKFCTGLVLAAILYTLVHLGGGGGLGWGGGTGDGIGPGKGTGKDTGAGKDGPSVSDTKDKSKRLSTNNPGREILEVELLGPKRYPGALKFYLLDRKDPPIDLAALEEIFKTRTEKIELHVIYTMDSVDRGHGAAERLRAKAEAYRIPLVQIDELPGDPR